MGEFEDGGHSRFHTPGFQGGEVHQKDSKERKFHRETVAKVRDSLEGGYFC